MDSIDMEMSEDIAAILDELVEEVIMEGLEQQVPELKARFSSSESESRRSSTSEDTASVLPPYDTCAIREANLRRDRVMAIERAAKPVRQFSGSLQFQASPRNDFQEFARPLRIGQYRRIAHVPLKCKKPSPSKDDDEVKFIEAEAKILEPANVDGTTVDEVVVVAASQPTNVDREYPEDVTEIDEEEAIKNKAAEEEAVEGVQSAAASPQVDPNAERKKQWETEWDVLRRNNNQRTSRKKTKGQATDRDENLQQMVKDMKEAAKLDRAAHAAKEPALNKLNLLKKIRPTLIRADMFEYLVENQVLSALAEWISPHPDGSLVLLDVRSDVLRIIRRFPAMDTAILKQSGLGSVIRMHSVHPDETKENKLIAQGLFRDWCRTVLHINDEDIRNLTPQQRAEYDYDRVIGSRTDMSLEEFLINQRNKSSPSKASNGASTPKATPDATPASTPGASASSTPVTSPSTVAPSPPAVSTPAAPSQEETPMYHYNLRARRPKPSLHDYFYRPSKRVEPEQETKKTPQSEKGNGKKLKRASKRIQEWKVATNTLRAKKVKLTKE
ncbi:hypothetical protein L596_000599 [Steinernema carpocapsae]|uniref:TFIIS N-terminal domain-containing protein n=1 Tax=Steinernema carpocapsae TaxID=34508 RepID=A0A4U8UMT8_STECR|nr:hypothetical protein L596_000599 [Steinernema carpocapsae]